ncbi:hypothetical protein C7S18_23840 (plasmid) [Ahniella affigens]|uniref:KfrA N-terminal DNA-binding domain-containing protein n=1 Tax=Ahniella affigens TaxID=2021234 RepID=A0A2P1PZR2_9GAMM|nr:DNA-binding protein [Ahniella affigens]AVQ00333.1 hypothetical protein C7S18_23840 [Ahniella affigens]
MASTHDHDAEIEALLEDRLQEVREEWRQQHGLVPMSPVTETDVSEILLLLAKHGVPPTVRAVRDVVGAGSLSALTPMVRAAWIRKELPQRLATLERGQAVPDRLLQFWDLLLTDATAKAKELLYRQTRELDERRAGLDGREEALMHKERVIDERVAGLVAQLGTAEASASELRAALSQRTQERDALQAQLLSARDVHVVEVGQLRERLDVAEANAAAVRERLAIREGELGALRVQLASETRRADDAKVLANEARTEATAATQRADRLVLERAQLDVELAGTRSELAIAGQAVKRAEQLDQELKLLRTEHSELRTSYDCRGRDLITHQATIAQLSANARVAERIEVELKGAREELRSVIQDRDSLLRNPPVLLARIEAMEAVLRQILLATSNNSDQRSG